MPLKIAILLLSAGAIAYEILLIRIFSIVQWHHFAAMIISLALLGYGMSGTVLSLLAEWLSPDSPGHRRGALVLGSALFGILSLACVVLAQRIPFNPLAVVWDPWQFLYLLAVYLLLTIPFFFAATAIGVALMSRPGSIGGLYGADLLGAGMGAGMLLVALYWWPVSVCLQIVGILGCLAGGVFAIGYRRTLGCGRWALLSMASLTLVVLWPQSWLALQMSEYKALHKALLVPGAEVLAARSGPLGLLTAVGNSSIPFRHAPGLSLDFPGRLPDQWAVFTDGDSMTVIQRATVGTETTGHLSYLPAAVAYSIVEDPAVLILGIGGGSEILMARGNQASSIHAVEANPHWVDLHALAAQQGFGGALERSGVVVHLAEPRSFLSRHDTLFDLIQIPLDRSPAAATSGTQALGASRLFTVESFAEMLRALRPDGILVSSQGLKIPPRDNLRLFATLVEALRELGVEEPGRHMAQIRGWGTVATLVKRSPLVAGDISAIVEFCRDRSFDLTALPGLTEERTNTYNRLQEAYLFLGNQKILAAPHRFFESYKFDVRPATDNRPFFSNTFKWRTLPELLTMGSRSGMPLVEWGYLILVATVVQAVAAAVGLILIPLRFVRRLEPSRTSLTVLVFFASLGMGFMLLELAFFERLTPYLGHPTYSAAVVLSAFLIAAGLGSTFSRRLLAGPRGPAPTLRRVFVAILALSSIYWLALPPLIEVTRGLSVGQKMGVTFASLVPLGFLLGLPFPLGLGQAAARKSIWLPWAWGINGSASVVGAAAAPLIAMHLGFSALNLAGLLCYALATFSAVWLRSPLGLGHREEE